MLQRVTVDPPPQSGCYESTQQGEERILSTLHKATMKHPRKLTCDENLYAVEVERFVSSSQKIPILLNGSLSAQRSRASLVD